MISFIVIGRNEAVYLKACLDSIVQAINIYGLEAELIYVDSLSDDNSVELATQVKNCRVFRITGEYNAAVARNIGVKEAKGDSLIFLDGDMELQSEFLPEIIDDNGDLKYEFVSGNFINIYYSNNGKESTRDYYRKIYCEVDTLQPTTGGLFAIKRSLWDEVGGMRPVFKKGQDLDFGYRLALKGHMLLRKKEVMAHHHTRHYKERSKMWEAFKNGATIYPRSVLYRKNITNRWVLKRVLSSDPTLLILLFCIVAAVFYEPVFLMVYPGTLVAGVAFLTYKSKTGNFFSLLIFHLFRDIQNLLTFFFYYPGNQIEYHYEEVR